MRPFPTACTLMTAALLASCGGSSDDGGDTVLSKRPLKKEHLDLVKRFAEAVVRKDYKAAYEDMSGSYKTSVGWIEFEKSITRYRGGAGGAITFKIQSTEDDVKAIHEDAMLRVLVPEDGRKRVLEEVAVHFTVKGKTPDDEGFWALVCWIVEEGGAFRILNYYQDD